MLYQITHVIDTHSVNPWEQHREYCGVDNHGHHFQFNKNNLQKHLTKAEDDVFVNLNGTLFPVNHHRSNAIASPIVELELVLQQLPKVHVIA